MEYVNLAIGSRGWPSARTKLDGVVFVLEAVWVDAANFPAGVWTLNLSQADGTLLRAGLVMRHAEDLLAPFAGAEFPGGGRGKLRPWDGTHNDLDPGRRDLARSSAVRLVYITAAEAT